VKEKTPGVLFIPYKAGQIAALRSTISAWMRLAIFETMDQEEVRDADSRRPDSGEPNRRLWFIVDELDALGQIDGLKDALARLRKFGGRCVLGFQSIAQVSSTYGQGEAHTLVENCGNTLILRCSASEGGGTARFASQLIGEREVMHTTVSKSRRVAEFSGSITHSEHLSVEPAVLPSQVEQLPDLAGYLKFASNPRWHRVRLDAKQAWQQRQSDTKAAEVLGTERRGGLNSSAHSGADHGLSAYE
jgi:type IV secretory pathway TraG/TraD family ATPase VirD4